MKLWGGRFTKETNELVNNFNASISFDQKFYKQDIEGSIAHATMLGKQGIIPESESEQIISCHILFLNFTPLSWVRLLSLKRGESIFFTEKEMCEVPSDAL